jgi:hypothetical protein
MAPRYVVFDLDRVREDLGGHFVVSQAHTYTEVCPECGERVGQDMNRCQICGQRVVWKNSKTWSGKYGSAALAIRKLNVVEPTERAGRLVCQLSSIEGFANQAEATRWDKCVRELGLVRMEGIARICAQRATKRGVLAYAMNWAEKEIREKGTDEDPFAPEVIQAPEMW